MVFNLSKKMKEWAGKRVLLESRLGNSHGRILYGVRKPLVSQIHPLIECEPGSRKRIGDERPCYYFVSDEHEGLKIPLLVYSVDNERVKAVGRSAGSIFRMTLVGNY